jgi:uncharacterized membrane protein YgcG
MPTSAAACCLLLHAPTAGPSLCVALRGSSLTAAQLAQLMPARPGSSGLTTAAAAAAAAAAAGGGGGGSSGGGGVSEAATAVQLGLSSVWAVTDVLQVGLGYF